MERNVVGSVLKVCSCKLNTGFLRDGFCHATPFDRGRHTVCAKMSKAFLSFTKEKGNDLTSPRPEFGFPGLKEGDFWCLCVLRWIQAWEAGVAPPVVLEACDESVLELMDLDVLQQHAIR
ncbi:MAG: DUF2237 domain-containing protein [Pseudomonadota bacterium]|nr:DUF2237 domain-containing protein [Pseudomonadota bacterium]